MEKVTLDQFIAEIEATFSNYSDTNDIDRQSIKTWVIQALRKFGKNICDKSEAVVNIKNSRGLLPENFKSLTFAVKVKTEPFTEKEKEQLVLERRYIQNPAIWDSITQEYVTDYCKTRVTTEKVYAKLESTDIQGFQLLSLTDDINKETVDVDCFNLHPYIRNNYEHQISIVNRTVNTNFKEGIIYVRYNSLPSVENEIAIPILTTGALYDFVENHVKWKLAEGFIANNKNSQGLTQLYSAWKADERLKFVQARSEATANGLSSDWARKVYKQNLKNRLRLGL